MKIKHKVFLATSMLAFAFTHSNVVAGESLLEPKVGKKADFLQPFGSIRARYEFGDVEGFDKSTLGSIRTRVGLQTMSLSGFRLLVEGEHTIVLTGSDRYRPFPGFPPATRTVIADPDNLQLNRAQVMYHSESLNSTVTIGRQVINLDDQRFIGAVGWRQNDQTFDAIRFDNNSLDNVKFSYSYITKVNRIFGTNSPTRGLQEWDSDSHLAQIEYSGIENHKLRLFSYLLDFDNAATNSTNTFGLELTGDTDSSIGKLHYLFTAAIQNDAADNHVDYQEYYLRGQLGIEREAYDYGVGVEMMTSDGAGRFLFPLGTNHAYNGFADAFVITPVNGLIDSYAWIGTEAFGAKHKLALHHFESDEGATSLGWELDYAVTKKLCPNALGIFKVSYLNGENAQADTTRASLELNFTF